MFNTAKFEQKQFKDRTAEIKVPELKEFFDDDSDPVWIVKCLSGPELGAVNDAVSANYNLDVLIRSLAGNDKKEKVDAVKDIIGVAKEKVPDDIVKRLKMLNLGSVAPECPEHIAVKLAENFPTTFYKLTNKIIGLIGLGKLGE